jgi:phosphate-selective porin
MKKTNYLTTLCLLFVCFSSIQTFGQTTATDSLKQTVNELNKAVEVLKRIKVTGWVQAQFQVADTLGVANFDGGNFGPHSDSRFMIRRGRVKFTYTQKLSQFVMQINGSERGFNLVEIFGKVTDPWTKSISLTVGVMNRPFGFEIDQSSQFRESPERSRYTQILMPNERDLGAKITYEPTKESKLHGLRLDAGFYNGQGIAVPGTTSTNNGVNEFDSKKDFIGRLIYYKETKDQKYRGGLGVSHYNGGIVNPTKVEYSKLDKVGNGYAYAVADSAVKTSTRKYVGMEFFASAKSALGTTILRGEYISGTQPGVDDNTASPNALPTKPIYSRSFNGAYIYFIQRIAKTKHEVAAKYEWYDPNTDMKGKELKSINGINKTEIKYNAVSLTYSYYYDDNIKFMLSYNMVTNEKTEITGFRKDISDNIFTARMQYRF